MTGGTVSDSDTGIEIQTANLMEGIRRFDSCTFGFLLNKSSVVLAAPRVVKTSATGVEASECRIKISGGEFSGNTVGARISGGEGQIVMSPLSAQQANSPASDRITY